MLTIKQITEKGKRIVATFDMQPGEELMMKVALSTTSVDGAKKNLEAEIPAWDFDGVKNAAHNEWNNYLSRIEIDGTDDEKTNFYTCFYHALIQPNQISDVDGMYRNAADSIVKAGTGTFYSTFSLWDTYRAAHPFYTLVIPERVDGFVNSLIEQGEVQGFLPIWALWGKENFCMIGNHGVSVIAEAYRKRVPDLYEAEELTGDVFLSFYRNMDSYDEEKGSIATWLYAITANRLKNYYRDKKTHYSLEILKQQTIPREKMPEEIVAKIMREETLRKSLEQLSDREREILLGRFYYQKSSTELGRQMNLSPGNVRMIQKRALEKLRMIMEKQGE